MEIIIAIAIIGIGGAYWYFIRKQQNIDQATASNEAAKAPYKVEPAVETEVAPSQVVESSLVTDKDNSSAVSTVVAVPKPDKPANAPKTKKPVGAKGAKTKKTGTMAAKKPGRKPKAK